LGRRLALRFAARSATPAWLRAVGSELVNRHHLVAQWSGYAQLDSPGAVHVELDTRLIPARLAGGFELEGRYIVHHGHGWHVGAEDDRRPVDRLACARVRDVEHAVIG